MGRLVPLGLWCSALLSEGRVVGYYKRLMIEAMQPKEEPPMEVLGWVPVKARVPDEDKEQFLVASGDYIGVAWWHAEPQKFIHEDIDNAWTPTHWMPLPEPPEVK